jgi:tetratricopeptide (TPR) repeat protein
MSSSRDPRPEKPQALVSWKEIAAFLNRAERTVKRWESERGLPVHRVPGGERGGVFAYPEELEAWLLGQESKSLEPQSSHSASAPENQAESSLIPATVAGGQIPFDPSPSLSYESAGFRRLLVWMTGSVIALGFVIALIVLGHSSRSTTLSRNTISANANVYGYVPKPMAEELYLQGRYQWSLRTADSLSKSIDSYTQAIVIDPSYAQAYAGLAESYELLPEYGHITSAEGFARARVAANRALELDPNLAAGHRAKAFELFWGEWNIPDSDDEFRRALALAPNEMETHHWYATVLLSRLQRSESLAQADEALRLGPTNPSLAADVAFIRASFRVNRAGAIETLRELARTQPSLVKPSRYLARLDLDDGRYQEFLSDFQNAASISHNPVEAATAEAASRGWARAGKIGMFEAMREVQQGAFERSATSGYWLARTYLLLGKPNEALHYFKAAYDRNDFNLINLAGCECITSLKNTPGYAALLRQVHDRTFRLTASTLGAASPARPKKPSVIGNHIQ